MTLYSCMLPVVEDWNAAVNNTLSRESGTSLSLNLRMERLFKRSSVMMRIGLLNYSPNVFIEKGVMEFASLCFSNPSWRNFTNLSTSSVKPIDLLKAFPFLSRIT